MNPAIDAIIDQYEQKRISRRELLTALVAAAGALPLAGTAAAQTSMPVSTGRSMNHVSLSVSDVERSARFYQRVLGLNVISRPANGGLNLGLGEESFLGLYAFDNPGSMHHLCIGVDDYNAEAMATRLDEHGIDARINRNPANRTSGGDQLYFEDPDGITVQLAQHGYLG
jgi:catechol 2,3-dioxygenase-like lactoylglutathione lyase family enzyme